MEIRNIAIMMGRCSKSKQGFGIRFERRAGDEWAGTWAFAIKDAAAKREGYERTRMNGTFSFDAAFPGCPHCSSQSFFLCGCGKIACMRGEGHRVTCPWCGASGEVSGVATSLDGGGDR